MVRFLTFLVSTAMLGLLVGCGAPINTVLLNRTGVPVKATVHAHGEFTGKWGPDEIPTESGYPDTGYPPKAADIDLIEYSYGERSCRLDRAQIARVSHVESTGQIFKYSITYITLEPC